MFDETSMHKPCPWIKTNDFMPCLILWLEKPTCNWQKKTRLETTPCAHNLHSKKRTTCSGLMKTSLSNVLLPTLFKVVNNIVQHCYICLQASSGSTILNNIVDDIEQCGQQYIVQACLH